MREDLPPASTMPPRSGRSPNDSAMPSSYGLSCKTWHRACTRSGRDGTSEERNTVSRNTIRICSVIVVAALSGACANTVRGVKQDTEKAAEKTAAGANTVDVKAALIADGRVDASNINVDTNSSTKTVVLKGTVPTAQQKTTAESIAKDRAEGYSIVNQLTVTPAAK